MALPLWASFSACGRPRALPLRQSARTGACQAALSAAHHGNGLFLPLYRDPASALAPDRASSLGAGVAGRLRNRPPKRAAAFSVQPAARARRAAAARRSRRRSSGWGRLVGKPGRMALSERSSGQRRLFWAGRRGAACALGLRKRQSSVPDRTAGAARHAIG